MKYTISTALCCTAFLIACQNVTFATPQPQAPSLLSQPVWRNLPQTQADIKAKAAEIRRAAQGKRVQQTLYFNADWQLVSQKDPKGFYRQSYGLQKNGLYLMQDFYANGTPQAELFYGTKPENSDYTDVRGYLISYKRDGGLDMIWDITDQDVYNNITFCAGEPCFQLNSQGDKFEETVLKQGKILAKRVFDNPVLARYEAFYPNGKKAYMIEATDFNHPKSYRMTQQYYLPNGAKSQNKPHNPEFTALEHNILTIEKQAANREVQETAWQDAIDGYPLIEQQIQIIRRDGSY